MISKVVELGRTADIVGFGFFVNGVASVVLPVVGEPVVDDSGASLVGVATIAKDVLSMGEIAVSLGLSLGTSVASEEEKLLSLVVATGSKLVRGTSVASKERRLLSLAVATGSKLVRGISVASEDKLLSRIVATGSKLVRGTSIASEEEKLLSLVVATGPKLVREAKLENGEAINVPEFRGENVSDDDNAETRLLDNVALELLLVLVVCVKPVLVDALWSSFSADGAIELVSATESIGKPEETLDAVP
jgi:hypothetical protein